MAKKEKPDSELTKWYKPDGSEIMLNDKDATIEQAVALGWDIEKPKAKK